MNRGFSEEDYPLEALTEEVIAATMGAVFLISLSLCPEALARSGCRLPFSPYEIKSDQTAAGCPIRAGNYKEAPTSLSNWSMSSGLARHTRAPHSLMRVTFSSDGYAVMARTSACLVASWLFIRRQTS